MTFKKLALAAAVAVAPMGVQAADLLDDSALANMTGQDGLAITLGLDVRTDTLIHDTDGVATQAGYSFAGAIVITGLHIATPVGNDVQVAIDAGDDAVDTSAPTLNVQVSIPSGTVIETGALSVANSNRDNANGWGAGTLSATILNNAVVTLGAVQMNIQLGSEPQGHMVAIDTNIIGGLAISGFALNDVGGSITGGAIGAGQLTVTNNGGGDLTADLGIDVDATRGLVITLNQLGAAGTGLDVRLEGQYLGDPTRVVGDVEMRGLTLGANTIAIAGKP